MLYVTENTTSTRDTEFDQANGAACGCHAGFCRALPLEEKVSRSCREGGRGSKEECVSDILI